MNLSFHVLDDRIVLQKYSTITAIVLLVYARIAYVSTRILLNNLRSIIEDPQFPLIIALIDEISLRCFLLLIPFFLWRKGRNLEKLFNDWLDYQVMKLSF